MWVTGAIVDDTFCDVSKPSRKRTDAILDVTCCDVSKPSRKIARIRSVQKKFPLEIHIIIPIAIILEEYIALWVYNGI